MNFDITCSNCRAELTAEGTMHGAVLNCPSCGNLIKVKKPDKKKISKTSQCKIEQIKNEKKDTHIFSYIGPFLIAFCAVKWVFYVRQKM